MKFITSKTALSAKFMTPRSKINLPECFTMGIIELCKSKLTNIPTAINFVALFIIGPFA